MEISKPQRYLVATLTEAYSSIRGCLHIGSHLNLGRKLWRIQDPGDGRGGRPSPPQSHLVFPPPSRHLYLRHLFVGPLPSPHEILDPPLEYILVSPLYTVTKPHALLLSLLICNIKNKTSGDCLTQCTREYVTYTSVALILATSSCCFLFFSQIIFFHFLFFLLYLSPHKVSLHKQV